MRLFLLCCAVLIGCNEPTRIEYAEFAAPPVFDTLWAQVEACSGLSRSPVSRYGIAYTASADSFYVDGKGWAWGEYIRDTDRILLAPAIVAAWTSDTVRNDVIRHEMLHAHLWVALHVGGHPAEYFVTKCGALVAH